MNVQNGKLLAAFEHVQPPLGLRFPRFGRLAVLHDDAVERVCVLEKLAGKSKIDAILLFGRGGSNSGGRDALGVLLSGRLSFRQPRLSRFRFVLPAFTAHGAA